MIIILILSNNSQVYILCGIYVGCAVIAFCTIALLLDNITLDKKQQTGDAKISVKLFLSTLKHWWQSTPQKLLTFLTIYSGIEQAFITGDFTKVIMSVSKLLQLFVLQVLYSLK